MKRALLWSYGGGVQSVAIAVLVADGRLPKPELVVMADTGRESSLTWDYTNRHIVPMFQALGVRFEIAPHSLATSDLYRPNGLMLLPAYVEGGGRLSAFCSSDWKKEVFRKYIRAMGYGPKKPIALWFGMSLDEIERLRISDVKWIENLYPLVFDVKLRRHECVKTISDFGLPVPPKSACWMCPNRNDAEWQEQKETAPGDFALAVKLEAEIREKDAGLYLHKSRAPLSEANFIKADDGQLELCANWCWS